MMLLDHTFESGDGVDDVEVNLLSHEVDFCNNLLFGLQVPEID